eukprot:10334310-Alexandrium_andersonii.AAC.1
MCIRDRVRSSALRHWRNETANGSLRFELRPREEPRAEALCRLSRSRGSRTAAETGHSQSCNLPAERAPQM